MDAWIFYVNTYLLAFVLLIVKKVMSKHVKGIILTIDITFYMYSC